MINKLYIKQCCLIVWSVEKIQKVKILIRTKNGRIMLLSKCKCAIVKNWNLWKNKKLVDY